MIVTNEVKRITSSKYNLSNEVHKEVITRAKISGSGVENTEVRNKEYCNPRDSPQALSDLDYW